MSLIYPLLGAAFAIAGADKTRREGSYDPMFRDLGWSREGMQAVDAYRQVIADGAKPGYFASARLELAYFGLGDALRGQRHYAEAAQAYEQAAANPDSSPELKIRCLVAAGECRDLNNERPLAVKDYQAAIAAGPNTSRADTARKRLKSPYKGN